VELPLSLNNRGLCVFDIKVYKCKGPKIDAQHPFGLVTMKDLPIHSAVLKDMRKYIL
jgi:hypothetical protein